MFGNTPLATHVVPPSMLYSSVGSAGVTLIVPVATPQLGAEVIAITGAAGAVAAAIVNGALAGEIQVWSATLRAITVNAVPVASPGKTPLATHVAPPSILYSNVGSGAVTLIVPVATAHVAAVVTVIVGATGAVPAVNVIELLAPDTQVGLPTILAITV